MRRALALAVGLTLSACGDSPTGPADGAGIYSGPITISASASLEVGGAPVTMSIEGTLRIVVTQDGEQITIRPTFTVLGETEEGDVMHGAWTITAFSRSRPACWG